ncbi:MAG TPA: PQQ-binding-like beta-propeller repeat protein [Tepidisphaeraceae bacterium]|nr:PQQ-binding-like beta-propeller repeat protein [Tepidisphaeraceae bacterium]
MRPLVIALLAVVCSRSVAAAPADVFARENLVAWCIVPFDAKKRSPEERAAMMAKLGIRKFAYDWRAEHLPTLEREIAALKKHEIELTAFWFPGSINKDARFILDTLAKHKVKTQLWVMASPKAELDQAGKVAAAADAIRPIALEAGKIGCTVALYNHGGWFGEPENQIAVIEALKREGVANVGIVYNFHHGHDHLARFAELLGKMKPHLYCLNLNGMTAGGDKKGMKIMPIGQGDLDFSIIRSVRASGYAGPIGVLNHTNEDAEGRLLDNIEGLEYVVKQTAMKAAIPKPVPRTWKAPGMPKAEAPVGVPQAAKATSPSPVSGTKVDYWAVEDPAERATLPEFQTIPAAPTAELTPTNGWPGAAEYAAWFRSHGNNANTRYSPLTQITRENVGQLKKAWTYNSTNGYANIQCNPIVVDGVMYVPTPTGQVAAVNAETGKQIWAFRPGNGRPAHRGITYVPADPALGTSARLLFGAGKALWAVDPKTGQPIESFGEKGKIEIPPTVVAPAVYKNVIVFAGWDRDVFGHDLVTGKRLWTFETIARGDDPGASTWDKQQAGANCWGGMALDASRGIAYVATGSPKPNFVGVGHLGDNLYSNCVLAIDALTGKRLWHFQEVRHDIWDLDIPAPPVLVTIDKDGRKVDAVAAVTKIGNTLVLDRVTGKPLFPFRLRRAPVSKLPGERTSPYQPDVELPEPFARRAFALDQITTLSPDANLAVSSKLDDATFGWFEPFEVGKPLAMYGFHGGAEWTGACFDPASGYLIVSVNHILWTPSVHRNERPPVDETKVPATPGRTVYLTNCAGCHGASREGLQTAPSLHGLGHRLKDDVVMGQINNGKGIMTPIAPTVTEAEKKALLDYLFDRDRPNVKTAARPERPAYRDGGYPKVLDDEGYPGVKPPWGELVAVNLSTGRIAWRVPLGEYPELTAKGIAKTGTENFGGPIVTAGGVVFCSGTRDNKIRAFDAWNGAELWSAVLPYAGSCPPSTYQVGGKQYVVIPATGGGKLNVKAGDAWVAFSLP